MFTSIFREKQNPTENPETTNRKQLLKRRIKEALVKFAGIDTDLIQVHIHDDKIILNGVISNPNQKEDADEVINVLTKGEATVENNLKVEEEYLGAEFFISPTATNLTF